MKPLRKDTKERILILAESHMIMIEEDSIVETDITQGNQEAEAMKVIGKKSSITTTEREIQEIAESLTIRIVDRVITENQLILIAQVLQVKDLLDIISLEIKAKIIDPETTNTTQEEETDSITKEMTSEKKEEEEETSKESLGKEEMEISKTEEVEVVLTVIEEEEGEGSKVEVVVDFQIGEE